VAITQEEAVQLASNYYSSQGSIVLRSQAELETSQGDHVLVFVRAIRSGESPLQDPEESGGFWWVLFEELERKGDVWTTPSIHPSGGLVRVNETTGELYQPPDL
jgi:hypothetical protein